MGSSMGVENPELEFINIIEVALAIDCKTDPIIKLLQLMRKEVAKKDKNMNDLDK